MTRSGIGLQILQLGSKSTRVKKKTSENAIQRRNKASPKGRLQLIVSHGNPTARSQKRKKKTAFRR